MYTHIKASRKLLLRVCHKHGFVKHILQRNRFL